MGIFLFHFLLPLFSFWDSDGIDVIPSISVISCYGPSGPYSFSLYSHSLCSYLVVTVVPSSCLLIRYSFPSILLLSSSAEFSILVIVLLVLKFTFGSFYIFYFFPETSEEVGGREVSIYMTLVKAVCAVKHTSQWKVVSSHEEQMTLLMILVLC